VLGYERPLAVSRSDARQGQSKAVLSGARPLNALAVPREEGSLNNGRQISRPRQDRRPSCPFGAPLLALADKERVCAPGRNVFGRVDADLSEFGPAVGMGRRAIPHLPFTCLVGLMTMPNRQSKRESLRRTLCGGPSMAGGEGSAARRSCSGPMGANESLLQRRRLLTDRDRPFLPPSASHLPPPRPLELIHTYTHPHRGPSPSSLRSKDVALILCRAALDAASASASRARPRQPDRQQ
jgi:hypothetical protein